VSNAPGDTSAANHAVIADPPTVTRPGSTSEQTTFWRFNEEVTTADGRAFAALPFATRIEQLDALNASMAELNEIRLRLDSALPVQQSGRKRP
jgi:hypothetical protein